jgi:tetratricopeptide (TPR) repeat protein
MRLSIVSCVVFASFVTVSVASADPSLNEQFAALEFRIAQSPTDVSLHLRHAELLRRDGRDDEALTELALVEALDPSEPRVWVVRSRVHLGMRRFAEARSAAEVVLSMDPSSADGHVLRGRALRGLGDLVGAIDELEQALRVRDELEVHLERGDLLVRTGRLDEAALGYREALAAHGGAVVIRRALIDVEILRLQFPAAIAEIDAILEHARVRTDWLLLRAELFAALGRTDEAARDRAGALADADRLLALRHSAAARAARADALVALGRRDEAIREYEAAIEQSPGLERAIDGLSRARGRR